MISHSLSWPPSRKQLIVIANQFQIPDSTIFFQWLSYFSTERTVQDNTMTKTARFQMDFNYEVVMQQAIQNSTAIYTRCIE